MYALQESADPACENIWSRIELCSAARGGVSDIGILAFRIFVFSFFVFSYYQISDTSIVYSRILVFSYVRPFRGFDTEVVYFRIFVFSYFRIFEMRIHSDFCKFSVGNGVKAKSQMGRDRPPYGRSPPPPKKTK